jgi:hypothetical protein
LGEENALPRERETFAAFASAINLRVQAVAARENGRVERGFHAKSHACTSGVFEVAASNARSKALAFGLFGRPGVYPAYVRFSNGTAFRHGFARPGGNDLVPDVRGLAIKVIGVEGKKILAGEEDAHTQDFLMTNGQNSFVDTATQFMEFARAHVYPVAGVRRDAGRASVQGGLAVWGARNPRAALRLAKSTARPIANVDDLTYWSGSPFRMGARAVKFTARPCAGAPRFALPGLRPNYLGDRLADRVARRGACFDFYLQFQLDPALQPVERHTVPWVECRGASDPRLASRTCSPLHRVARLTIPRKSIRSADGLLEHRFCDKLAFTPWHTLAPEQGRRYGPFHPIGNMNRARRFVYESSARYRHHLREPTHVLSPAELRTLFR